MDPLKPGTFHQYKTTLPHRHVYHYVHEEPTGADAIRGTCVLLHGFPDLWQVRMPSYTRDAQA